MATISDVAKKAGVSTTLVSRYLNQVKGVSAASKEKIESAIRELQYVPDESARMLVRRRGGGAAPQKEPAKPVLPAIAMICSEVDFRLISCLYTGVKHALWSDEAGHSYHVLLFPIAENEMQSDDRAAVFAYAEHTCSGILCFCENREALGEALTKAAEHMPVLLVTPDGEPLSLHAASEEYDREVRALEARAAEYVRTLCSRITEKDHTLSEEHVPVSFLLLEAENDHSTRSRTLQSHLL